MMKHIIIIFISAISMFANGQGINNLWLMGYDDFVGPPWGTYNLNFNAISFNLDTVHYKNGNGITNANIADTSGNLLFYSTGSFVANSTGDTMQNGTGLNPSWYTSQYPEGLNIPQANLILAKPNSSNLYYLFHSTIDYPQQSTALYLYLTTIDMSLNNGLGAVISKKMALK